MKFYLILFCVICASAVNRKQVGRDENPAGRSVSANWNEAVLFTAQKLKSTLFKSCVGADNTRTLQYSYIEDPVEEIAFVKFEITPFEKGLREVIWQKEIETPDIVDCFRASKDYMMFQYDGVTCRITNEFYCYECISETCNGAVSDMKEYVYLNVVASPSGCPANSDEILNEQGKTRCIGVYHQDEPFDEGAVDRICDYTYNGYIFQAGGLYPTFNAVRDYMRSKNYQGKFYVGVYFRRSSPSGYNWRESTFPDSPDVNSTEFGIQPLEPYFQEIVSISSEHDYLLVADFRRNQITGFICIGYPK